MKIYIYNLKLHIFLAIFIQCYSFFKKIYIYINKLLKKYINFEITLIFHFVLFIKFPSLNLY